VQLNIAEGYPWRPRPKWKHHLRIAIGSAMETIDALHFLLDVGAAPKENLFLLIDEAERSAVLLRGLLK
jgi:four helix bundle protein